MKYWDEVLFPEVLTLIRGERYLTMSDRQIADELIVLAKRAIDTFLFPHVSLEYTYEEDEYNNVFPKRYYFYEDPTDAEYSIIIAWMEYYWCKLIVSDADNYNNVYFDSNIKAFSPGNMLQNYRTMMYNYRDEARRLESRYYRKDDGNGTPGIGGTIDDE